jgi:hypothetical protein
MARNTTFWNQLLMRSDSIADIDPAAADAKEQVIAQLATIGEQFDRTFDPADQFEEYVAVTLCQALQRALTPRSTATCKMIGPKIAPKEATVLTSQAGDVAAKSSPAKSSASKAVGRKVKKRE